MHYSAFGLLRMARWGVGCMHFFLNTNTVRLELLSWLQISETVQRL